MKLSKNTQRITFACALFVLSALPSLAQLSYQGIAYSPDMPKSEFNLAVNNLTTQASNDPYDPNRYHLMGYMYYESYRDYDILKDYKGATLFADSCFFYFQKARDLLTPKELKKYGDYYIAFLNYKNPSNLVQQANYQYIIADLDSMVNESFQFKKQASSIYTYFNRSLENYKRANTIYVEICDRFETREDLLLLADQQLFDDLYYIAGHYDSTEIYFANYKNALEQFPIKRYNQTYTVKPIEKYQEDGKERANFFNTTFEIWNYKKWQKELKAEIDNKISVWRDRIQVYEDLLTARLEKLYATSEVAEEEYTIDESVIETIREYEENSALEYVFAYKVGKLNLFNQLNFKMDSTATFEEVAAHTVEVMSGVKSCRTLLSDIGKGTSLSMAKHREFFKKNYPDGIAAYMAEESRFLDTRLDVLNRQLEVSMQNITNNWRIKASDSVLYKGNTVRLARENPATNLSFSVTEEGKMITLATEKDRYGFQYIAGFQKQEGIHKAFIAAVKNNSVQWLTYPKVNARALVKQLHSEAATISTTPEGALVSVYTFVEQEKGISGHTTLLHYDTLGNIRKTIEVPTTNQNYVLYPRYASYTAGDGYQVVVKGDGYNLANFTVDKALLLLLDEGGTTTWEKEISIQGNVVALRPYGENILMLTNFRDLRMGAGRNYNAMVESTSLTAYNVLLAAFSKDGDVVEARHLPTDSPVFAKELITVAGVHPGVGIIGLNGEPTDLEKPDKPFDPLIVVYDAELNPISENFE